MRFGVGQPVRRKEDDRFLRGAGAYVDDIALSGALRAYVLRSPVAHARIAGVDAAAARAAPGAALVWTGADIAGRLAPLVNEFPLEQADGSPPAPVEVPPLAVGKVVHVGQPVAFVVAATLEAARDAAELIEIDYEPLPAVTDAEAALEAGAPVLHDAAPGNLAFDWEMGDAAAVEAAFAGAAHVARVRVRNQRLAVLSVEPRAIAVRHDAAAGRWEAWVGCQGAHGMRAKIARALGVEPDRVRVHAPDVGGAFGMKLMNHPEYGLAALAAAETGRPVVWTGDRSEAFVSDSQGRDMVSDVEGAFDAGGKVLAIRSRSVSNLGAYYSSFGAGVHTVFSAPITGGMYDLPCFHASVRGAFTNTTPTDAYRGAGRPEVIHLTERLMERAARDLGLEPAEIRRRNLLRPAQLPHRAHGGFTFDSLDPARNLDDALAAADAAGFAARRREAAERGRLRGFGLAYYMERTGGGPVENARLRVRGDGTVEAVVGTQSTGQGHETAWAQLIAERLGVGFDAVRLMPGDTDLLDQGGGTGGSRSAVMATRTFLLAAEDVTRQGAALAAELLEAAAADVEFTADGPAGGRFRVVGTDRSVGLFEAAASAEGAAIEGAGGVTERDSTYPNGCHAAEIEIDPQTGLTRLVAYAIVDDFGVVLNPMLVEGQVHGGVAQGAGQILGEAMLWDADGQPLTASLMDYQPPRAADLPSFSFRLNEVPCATNPLGIKGCGEAGSVAALPAVALAGLDALRAAGVEDFEPPMTPFRVWSALRAAADGDGGGRPASAPVAR